MREDYFHDYNEDDEGFVEDESGRTFWGSQGAGCLFVRNHPEDGRQLLVVLRSSGVEEPNTWGTTGGAVPNGETDLFSSALRETAEEVGSVPPHRPVTTNSVDNDQSRARASAMNGSVWSTPIAVCTSARLAAVTMSS